MIKLFSADAKVFLTNGEAVLKPLSAIVKEKDNGDYYLDLQTDLKYTDLIVQDAIVVVPTPKGEQPFRISNPEKTGTRIKSKCWHVSYDSRRLLIADSYVVDKDGQGALDHLNAATDSASPFTVTSDITRINSFRCVRKSLWEALQTVLERWGGHLVRDGFTISLIDSIAADRGAVIKYGKNLVELKSSENWDNVVTKLLPVGKDGILMNEGSSAASIYLVANGVSYAVPYTKTKSFKQDHIVRDQHETEADYKTALVMDLREQAGNYLNENKVPEINYTLSAHLDRVEGIGDVIQVRDPRLNIELLTQVTAYEYDCIAGRYISLEFGNHKRALSGLIPDIIKKIKEEA